MLNCKEYVSAELLSWYLPGGTAENNEHFLSGWPVRDIFSASTSRIEVHSVTATITCSVLGHCSRDRPLLNVLNQKDSVQYGRKVPTIEEPTASIFTVQEPAAMGKGKERQET
jgi:hypothetical protein